MSYEIIKKTAHSGNYGTDTHTKTHIVIHNTGNTASAKSEASYAYNDEHPSSYHYVLDGKEIYNTVPDKMRAYAVGAWKGATQLITNSQSISIEVCANGTKFTDAQIKQLTWLVQKLMKAHGIKATNVVRHYDCHTGHKICPGYYCGSDTADKRWKELHATITGSTTKTVAATFASYKVKVTTDILNVRSGAGATYKVVTTIKKGEVYTVVDEKNGWGKLKSGAGWISLKYTKKI